ncbi:MAG TPA: PASTA domain-containing protein [Acidimicrobiales bacterium]|nr:PASTA domain-containing protein [Acidimicrobiales bacterium]
MQRVADLLGRALGGRFHLLLPLGAGASAAVYLAEDHVLGRRVAVKVLHPALAADESFLRRFQSEARAAAGLRHPHIVQVYDWGEDDGVAYVVLEYLAGGSLRQILDRAGALSPAQVAQIGREAASGLAHAHARGLVHRDIKPANLLFDEEGRLAIADFGLARAMADATWTEPEGVILGTARYSSPEQAVGRGTAAPTDVYSLALVLTEALTGTVPFSADTTVATLMARQGRSIEAGPELGPLAPALTSASAADPAERLSAAALAAALDGVLRAVGPAAPVPLAPALVDTTEIGAPAGPRAGTVAPAEPDWADAPTRIGVFDQEAATMPATAGAVGPAGATRTAPAPPGGPVPAPPSRRGRRPALWVAVVLLAAVAAGVGAWLAVGVFKLATPSHPVPDTRGRTVAQAEAMLAPDKFHVRVGPGRYDEQLPVGQIVAESPAPGGSLKEGSTVTLYPSRGAAPRAVPDLTGLSQTDAVARLQSAGLADQVVTKNDETVPAGQVMDWSPKRGLQARGTVVTLTVSSGPAPRTIPSLAGESYDQAAAQLAQLGLVPKKAQVYDNTGTYPAGQVVATDPAAGASVAKGATVTVKVSRGAQMVRVPDVTGESVDQATSDLQQAGLVVSNVYGPPNRRVFVTDPPPGSQVTAGSSVDLYTH